MKQADVALLGFGNVGRAFARYASSDNRINVRAVADSGGGVFLENSEQVDRLIARKESGLSIRDFAHNSFIATAREFVNSLSPSGIRILVESLPTNLKEGEPALGLIKRALAEGINVVTVDKGPLALG